jgi:hypothetical protein
VVRPVAKIAVSPRVPAVRPAKVAAVAGGDWEEF